jgi:hypothetical protein
MTEWWVGDDAGLEQGWTLTDSPAGSGALVLQLEIARATDVRLEGDGFAMVDATGRRWTVGPILALDQTGRRLDAAWELAPEGPTIRVDDAGAVWPIEVDPIYSTASTTLTGATNDSLGWGVASAGDVDGDGYGDVIVGALGYSTSKGRAYVYRGSAAGLSTTVRIATARPTTTTTPPRVNRASM